MLKIYEELISFAKVNKEFADELDPGGLFWGSSREDQKSEPGGWLPIETAPQKREPWTMFVVIAFNVKVHYAGAYRFGGALYTSDPYCVWREINGSFARWPHSFPPTHWHPLPSYDPKFHPDKVVDHREGEAWRDA